MYTLVKFYNQQSMEAYLYFYFKLYLYLYISFYLYLSFNLDTHITINSRGLYVVVCIQIYTCEDLESTLLNQQAYL